MDILIGRVGAAAYEKLLRDDFSLFIHKCFATINPASEFLPNWHIDLLAEYLEACRNHELKRLIINLPPRSLKSVCVSVAWPAFLLGHNPAERIMAASYAASLSIKHSLDCRSILQAQWYRQLFPELVLSQNQNEKHKFITTAFGHRIATSVGGSATGEGGNFLIVDDPQNPLQVQGDATREVANEWFDHTFSSRLDDKKRGVIVVVMQRLHAHDLTGHLLEKGGWEHVALPAISREHDTYHFGGFIKYRNPGEVLHPDREDAALVATAKRELGSYMFEAQYQQNPLPLEGGMIRREWLRRYARLPEVFERVVQSWDTAIKAGSQHDASVCLTVGECEGGSYVLDVQVLRLEYPELKRRVMRLAAEWEPDAVLMEDKASGQSLLQDLRRETTLPLIPVMPVRDKVTRFAAVSPMIEAGRLFLPKESAWLVELEAEILSFPNGAHDDQVDALSQYLGWLKGKAIQGLQLRRL